MKKPKTIIAEMRKGRCENAIIAKDKCGILA
jgi:hypothetical protein